MEARKLLTTRHIFVTKYPKIFLSARLLAHSTWIFTDKIVPSVVTVILLLRPPSDLIFLMEFDHNGDYHLARKYQAEMRTCFLSRS